VLFLMALPLGCSGAETDPQAGQEQDILAAVQIYLREEKGIDPGAMSMKITDLAVEGDQARATVLFSSPDAPGGLQFQYTLQQEAGTWKVTGSAGEGAHGAQGEGMMMPEGHPSMPPEHPPVPEDSPGDAGSNDTSKSTS
jgi:hypothetical protein